MALRRCKDGLKHSGGLANFEVLWKSISTVVAKYLLGLADKKGVEVEKKACFKVMAELNALRMSAKDKKEQAEVARHELNELKNKFNWFKLIWNAKFSWKVNFLKIFFFKPKPGYRMGHSHATFFFENFYYFSG